MATDRYAKGKIYRLVNSVDNEFYVGSTCLDLAKRFYYHKNTAKKQVERRVYKHLNEIGFENMSIVLIEEYPCENKMQLERRERHWIDELKPTLNKYIPTRTIQEWYAENAEKERERKAKYKADNAEKERERLAKYRGENRDVINARARETYAIRQAKKKAEAQAVSS
jgi:group I intron endonuclease